jgi:hypothetical protein
MRACASGAAFAAPSSAACSAAAASGAVAKRATLSCSAGRKGEVRVSMADEEVE